MAEDSIGVLLLAEPGPFIQALVGKLSRQPGLLILKPVHLLDQAVRRCQRQAPHVALLHVRHARHVQLLAGLMAEAPLPVVVLTANSELGVQALHAGATEVLQADASVEQLAVSLRLMAGVRVVRPRHVLPTGARRPVAPRSHAPRRGPHLHATRLILVGASTGGPQVLVEILGPLRLPAGSHVVVAQHMPHDFHESFCSWLQSTTTLHVEIARSGALLSEGQVFLAPGDADLEVHEGGRLQVCAPPAPRATPNIDRLFKSAARLHHADLCGVLLTGMGRDGAQGLVELHQRGALTLVQDRHSSVVASMPETALGLGAADLVLSPVHIHYELQRWIDEEPRPGSP